MACRILILLHCLLVLPAGSDALHPQNEQLSDTAEAVLPFRDGRSETLVVAMAADFPPLSFLNAAGEPAGILADLWRLWSQKTGRNIRFHAVAWKGSVESLRQGTADVHSGMFYSDARARHFDFSRPMYGVRSGVYFAAAEPQPRIREMKGGRIGVIQGTYMRTYLENRFPALTVIPFQNSEEMVIAAKNGEIRAFASVVPIMDRLIAELGMSGDFNPRIDILYRKEILAAVAEGNEALLEAIESGLDKITPAEYVEIEKRWIPDPDKRYFRPNGNGLQLTTREKAWLSAHPVVRIGMIPGFEPYMFVGENGEFQGIIPDLAALIQDRADFRFESVSFHITELTSGIRNRFDVFPGLKSRERTAYLRFTDVLFSDPWVLVNRQGTPLITGLRDLTGSRLALVENLYIQDRIAPDYPDIQIHASTDHLTALKQVSQNRADAYIGPLSVAGYQIRHHRLTNLKIAAPAGYPDAEIRFGVRKDRPELAGILNKAVRSVTRTEYDEIVRKWVSVQYETGVDWAYVWNIFRLIIGGFGILLLASLFWNRRLSREIAERRRAESALAQSQELFSKAFHASPVAMSISTLEEGCFLEVNSRFLKLTGLSKETVVGMKSGEIGMWEEGVRDVILSELKSTGFVHQREVNLIKPRNAEVVSLLWFGDLVHIQNQPCIIASGYDVTDRKQAEEILKETNRKLEEAQKIAKLGWWRLSLVDNRVEWSPEVYKMYGLTPAADPITSEKVLSYVPPDYREYHQNQVNTLLAGGAADFEYPVHRSDKTVCWIYAKGKTEYDETGEPTHIFGFIQDITERKKTEAALAESERKLASLVRNIRVGIVVHDAGTRILLSNPMAQKILGFTRDEMLGKVASDRAWRFLREDGTRMPEEEYPVNRVLRTGRPLPRLVVGVEGNHLPDTAWVLASAVPEFAERGVLSEVVVTFMDITDRKQMQAALVESEKKLRVKEEQYRNLVERSPAVIYSFLPGTGGIYYSPQVRLLGYTPEELLKQPMLWHDSIHPDEISGINAAIDEAKQGKPIEVEYRIRHKDGRWLWLMDRTYTRRLPGGQVVLSGVAVDITDRKQMQAALVESEKKFRSLYTLMNEGVCLHEMIYDEAGDPVDYRILEVNPAYAEITGIPKEEAVGAAASALYQKSPPPFLSFYAEVAETGKSTVFEARFESGNKHLLVSAFSPGRGKFVTVFSDITRLEEDRKAARAASRAKSEFISNMSHELRTPLNAVLGYAQILLDEGGLPDVERERVETILHSGEHLLTLINDVLDIAKVEAGKLELEVAPVELRPLLRNAADILRVKANAKGVSLVEKLHPNLPRIVSGDTKRLRQVLLNLLSNAVKFTEKGAVTLAVRRVGDNIRFSVADTGIGITPEHREAIFEPFRQVSAASGKIEGTGLGLPISRRLVRLMGGELTVESTPGEGSVFQFEIPLPEVSKTRDPAPPAPRKNVCGYRGRRRKALVVDDIELNRRLLTVILKPLGFDVEEAQTGGEAVTKFNATAPDIIFMDLLLPDMEGEAVIRRIRAIETGRRPVIICVTGKARHEIKGLISEWGADDCMIKPIFKEVLLDKIQTHLDLEWTYASSETPARPREEPEEITPIPPTAENLETLRRLFYVGDIMGIRRRAEILMESAPETRDFCRRLLHYTHRFQLLEIKALLFDSPPRREESG